MLSRAFDRLEEGVIAFLLAVMTIITFGQVVARYVFNYSFVWALESVVFLFAWLIFLGISYGVKVNAHIGVDALMKALGARSRRVVGSIAVLCCMGYCALLLIGSWVYVEKMYIIGIYAQDVPIQQWIPRTVLLIGFGLTFIRFAQVLVRIVSGRDTGLHLADEAAEALKLRAADPGPGGDAQP